MGKAGKANEICADSEGNSLGVSETLEVGKSVSLPASIFTSKSSASFPPGQDVLLSTFSHDWGKLSVQKYKMKRMNKKK